MWPTMNPSGGKVGAGFSVCGSFWTGFSCAVGWAVALFDSFWCSFIVGIIARVRGRALT